VKRVAPAKQWRAYEASEARSEKKTGHHAPCKIDCGADANTADQRLRQAQTQKRFEPKPPKHFPDLCSERLTISHSSIGAGK
jgi:hypothetical protein